jgi:hypothetical protein
MINNSDRGATVCQKQMKIKKPKTEREEVIESGRF